MPNKDTEVAKALGIPRWVLDEMELRAIRRSIAEEVFEELFRCRRKRPKPPMERVQVAKLLRQVMRTLRGGEG